MFNLANILTGFNMLCGSVSILFALQGRLDLAVYMLLIAMILDFLDGFVARWQNTQGEMGKQLDSLADMISFGLAPGVLVFVLFVVSSAVLHTGSLEASLLMASMGESVKSLVDLYFKHLIYGVDTSDYVVFHGWNVVLPFVSLFIPFFSLFRLAKFNLDTRQSEQFIGLPTPANTLFFSGLAMILWFGFNDMGSGALLAEIIIREQILMSLTVLFSVLLVAEIPLIALKFKNMSIIANWDKYLLISGALILVVFLKLFALSFIVLLYLILSIISFFYNKSH